MPGGRYVQRDNRIRLGKDQPFHPVVPKDCEPHLQDLYTL